MKTLTIIKAVLLSIIITIMVSGAFHRCTGGSIIKPDLSHIVTIDSLNDEIVKRDSIISIMYSHLPFGKPLDTIDISSGFGYRKHPITHRKQMHFGIDLRANRKDTVYSAANGIVKRSGWYGGHGRYVELEHDFNFNTSYSHLYKILVENGDTVNKHQPIGLIGNTGFSTGPHLHYEIIKCDENVDPLDYLYINPDIY